jgi:hypothetical protein
VLPAEVEQVSDMPWIGQVLDLGRVEEDSEVGVLVVGVEAGSVVGIVDQFDLLDVLGLGLIEVGIGGVDDHAHRASLGNRLGHE